MKPKHSLTLLLMSGICAVAVASCETPGAAFPPASDLAVEPKPVPPDEVLTSQIAGEKHDNAVEAWGEAGWLQVSRLCRFFDEMGMDGLDCPPPAAPPRPG